MSNVGSMTHDSSGDASFSSSTEGSWEDRTQRVVEFLTRVCEAAVADAPQDLTAAILRQGQIDACRRLLYLMGAPGEFVRDPKSDLTYENEGAKIIGKNLRGAQTGTDFPFPLSAETVEIYSLAREAAFSKALTVLGHTENISPALTALEFLEPPTQTQSLSVAPLSADAYSGLRKVTGTTGQSFLNFDGAGELYREISASGKLNEPTDYKIGWGDPKTLICGHYGAALTLNEAIASSLELDRLSPAVIHVPVRAEQLDLQAGRLSLDDINYLDRTYMTRAKMSPRDRGLADVRDLLSYETRFAEAMRGDDAVLRRSYTLSRIEERLHDRGIAKGQNAEPLDVAYATKVLVTKGGFLRLIATTEDLDGAKFLRGQMDAGTTAGGVRAATAVSYIVANSLNAVIDPKSEKTGFEAISIRPGQHSVSIYMKMDVLTSNAEKSANPEAMAKTLKAAVDYSRELGAGIDLIRNQQAASRAKVGSERER